MANNGRKEKRSHRTKASAQCTGWWIQHLVWSQEKLPLSSEQIQKTSKNSLLNKQKGIWSGGLIAESVEGQPNYAGEKKKVNSLPYVKKPPEDKYQFNIKVDSVA